mmetsp:Transcript_5761/g.13113  ORF Transcript_5761/g.13113 Transcript_5761/m.13113 type:complete len:255 (-) Transcript_5761:371-1135(-)
MCSLKRKDWPLRDSSATKKADCLGDRGGAPLGEPCPELGLVYPLSGESDQFARAACHSQRIRAASCADSAIHITGELGESCPESSSTLSTMGGRDGGGGGGSRNLSAPKNDQVSGSIGGVGGLPGEGGGPSLCTTTTSTGSCRGDASLTLTLTSESNSTLTLAQGSAGAYTRGVQSPSWNPGHTRGPKELLAAMRASSSLACSSSAFSLAREAQSFSSAINQRSTKLSPRRSRSAKLSPGSNDQVLVIWSRSDW